MRIIRNQVGGTDNIGQILELISSLKPRLNDSHPRASFDAAEMSFHVLKVDRNVLAEVCVPRVPLALIIKYPVAVEGKLSKMSEWEAKQWETASAVLAHAQAGILPNLIAFDDRTSILFLAKLSGWTVHRILLMSSVPAMFCRRTRRAPAEFYELGRVLAILHTQATPGQSSPIWYDLDAKLASVSGKRSHDPLLAEGLAAFERSCDRHSRRVTWVHGNLRTENVLFTGNGAALIDLEDGGAGDPMEDLGRLLACMIVLPRCSVLSRRFCELAVAHVMRGYCAVARVSPKQLLACILGETLFAYGLGYVSVKVPIVRRCFKTLLRRSITNLMTLLGGDPEQFLARPSMIVV
jgi:hypothetical protein